MVKGRRVRFSGKDLEVGRRYLWRKEFVPLLCRYLDIHPGQRIVDVGCGTGSLTRLVAKALRGEGEAIGIDRNPQLISLARRITEESNLHSVVSFRQGDARRLALNDNFADRVICQAVLWTLPDPRSAIREMIRVCRPGGLVGAIEGAFDSVIYHYPGNERLSNLSSMAMRSNARGYKKLYGLDRGIGYKLPSLFDELGLERVRLDAYAYSWLEADDRIPTDYKVEFHRRDLDGMKHLSKGYEEELMAGGMSRDEIKENESLYMSRLKELVSEPDSIGKDFSTNAGIWFITTGKVPLNLT